MSTVNFDAAALAEFMLGDEAKRFVNSIGREVRDRARTNAAPISDKTDAIISVPGQDDEGLYVDVGYSTHHPGFYLWWWEVGTVNHPPRPHLRPAISPSG